MSSRPSTWLVVAGVAALAIAIGGVTVMLSVRNLPPGTTLAGERVGDPEAAVELAADIQRRLDALPVVLRTDVGQVEVAAGRLGVTYDEAGVRRAAADAVGADDWLARVTGGGAIELPSGLFFTTGEAAEVAERLSTDPVDGDVQVTASGLRVVDPVVGASVEPGTVSEAFREAAQALVEVPLADWPAALTVEIDAEAVQPRITQLAVDTAVERLEALTSRPVALQAETVPEDAQTIDGQGVPTREVVEVVLGREELLQMLRTEVDPDAIERERLRVVPDTTAPPAALTMFLDRAAVAPDLAVSVEGRSPTPGRVEVADPGRGGPADHPAYSDVSSVSGSLEARVVEPGLVPDVEATVQAVVQAMLDAPTAPSEAEAAAEPVEVAVAGRAVTEADPADLGIVAPVSTYTTFYEPGQARVTNIHRIAEIVDGTLVPPGGNYELNHAVGDRTSARGFVSAGAILDGEFIDDVGGGVSQFATTFFNAMWFSGIDIITHKPHSFYFQRYPAGREATIDYPGVDLELNNNTPFWILIDTAVTDDSVTVTFWSTPWFEVDTTMGPREPTADGFRITVQRRAAAPDGAVDDDAFTADYELP